MFHLSKYATSLIGTLKSLSNYCQLSKIDIKSDFKNILCAFPHLKMENIFDKDIW